MTDRELFQNTNRHRVASTPILFYFQDSQHLVSMKFIFRKKKIKQMAKSFYVNLKSN